MHMQANLIYSEKSWGFHLLPSWGAWKHNLRSLSQTHTRTHSHTHLSACQCNRLGGPEPSEAWRVGDQGHTGDLSPEEQLSTCCRCGHKRDMLRNMQSHLPTLLHPPRGLVSLVVVIVCFWLSRIMQKLLNQIPRNLVEGYRSIKSGVDPSKWVDALSLRWLDRRSPNVPFYSELWEVKWLLWGFMCWLDVLMCFSPWTMHYKLLDHIYSFSGPGARREPEPRHRAHNLKAQIRKENPQIKHLTLKYIL